VSAAASDCIVQQTVNKRSEQVTKTHTSLKYQSINQSISDFLEWPK